MANGNKSVKIKHSANVVLDLWPSGAWDPEGQRPPLLGSNSLREGGEGSKAPPCTVMNGGWIRKMVYDFLTEIDIPGTHIVIFVRWCSPMNEPVIFNA